MNTAGEQNNSETLAAVRAEPPAGVGTRGASGVASGGTAETRLPPPSHGGEDVRGEDCEICCVAYDAALNPRRDLLCGHALCGECLRRIGSLASSSSAAVSCPFCRRAPAVASRAPDAAARSPVPPSAPRLADFLRRHGRLASPPAHASLGGWLGFPGSYGAATEPPLLTTPSVPGGDATVDASPRCPRATLFACVLAVVVALLAALVLIALQWNVNAGLFLLVLAIFMVICMCNLAYHLCMPPPPNFVPFFII